MKAQEKKLPQLLILITGLLITVFGVYYYSLCPTVYLIDSGELATVSYTLGIAHPTGYPLYTILSYFFAHLPGEPIFNVNLLSAILSVIAALFMYVIARHVIKDRIAAIIPTLLFAFSPTIWRISVTNEVYPLTVLFTVIIILLLYRMIDKRYIYFLLYCIGLAFTNHIIILSLSIPVLVYLIAVYRPAFKHIFYGTICILLGASLYLYLITRTAGGATLAWGGTYNIQRLIWHITGKQYQVWMFSLSSQEILNNMANGLGIIARNFLYIFLIPVGVGFVELLRRDRAKFWLFISIIVVNFLYAVNYSIPDIESYYIPGFCILLIVSLYGFRMIKQYCKWYAVLPVGILFVLINYRACSLRHNTFAYDFSKAHVETLPFNSVVICTFWDIYAPTLYYQKVENKRNDLIIIDKELLRRTWYIRHLEREYPIFWKQVKSIVEPYLTELYKFEYDQPYNPQIIQARFIRMLDVFVKVRLNEGAYLAMPYPDDDLGQIRLEYSPVPFGLVIQIPQDTTSYQPFDFSQIKVYNPTIAYDERLIHNRDLITRMVQGNINFLRQHADQEAADRAQKWLTDFKSNFR